MTPSPAHLNDAAVAADYDLIYANWDAQVERLVQIMNGHLPVVPNGRLLDASCGSGLSIDAARRTGWTVTACDASPAMVQRARDRFPDVTYRSAGLLGLADALGARYDAVISVGNALPMLEPSHVPQALRELRDCTREGGALMVAIRDFSERIKGGVWRDDAVARAEARFAYRGADLIVYTLEIEDSRGIRTHEVDLHPIAPLELEAAVLSAGFAVTRSSRVAGRVVIAATAG
ncbi:MAG TPA: class I SAM-dependent methyltransferase [Gaiellales bacterium]